MSCKGTLSLRGNEQSSRGRFPGEAYGVVFGAARDRRQDGYPGRTLFVVRGAARTGLTPGAVAGLVLPGA